MNIRKIAYPLWFALASLVSLGLYFFFYFLDSSLLLVFGILTFPLAIISLIGCVFSRKSRQHVPQLILSIILSSIPFILIISFWFLWTFWADIFSQSRGSKVHGEAQTWINMIAFISSVQNMSKEKTIAIPQKLDELIQTLIENDENFSVISMSYNPWEETSQGRLVDYWGQPITLVVNSPTDYKLISCGYNSKDDRGQNDDIVIIFNPLVEGEVTSNWGKNK